MFKIQFRVQKSCDMPVCCEILDTLTLWNIEENKYMIGENVYKHSIFSGLYTKYKNIVNHSIFPVNYSGKVISNNNKYKYFILLLNGKFHGNMYYFINGRLFIIQNYYKGKLNTRIKFYNEPEGGYYIQNFSTHREFEFNKNGKLLYFFNDLIDICLKFYLNGKIKYMSIKYEQFKFTKKNGVMIKI
jgi:hypothetical protein